MRNSAILSLATLAVSIIAFRPMPASAAGAQKFTCGIRNGVPTTFAVMPNGRQIPMVRWVSDTFTGSGWSPQRRCEEVSARFTNLNEQGSLRYLTTGQLNGMNVICVSLTKGDRCSDLVYTLKPNQNPTATLRKLFSVRSLAVGPLNETGERLYIDVNEYLGIGSSDDLPQKSTGDNLNKW